jgi:hypothetical protein
MSNTINDFLGFNPNETEAAESLEGKREVIPNGDYKAVVSKAERKNNKASTGWFWELTFTLLEGDHEGKTVIHRFNMVNDNDTAVQIGRSQMKKFLETIKNLSPKDESYLCNIPVIITVKCKNSTFTNKNGEKVDTINNEITQIESVRDPAKVAAPKEPKAETEAEPEKEAETKKTPPWKKSK